MRIASMSTVAGLLMVVLASCKQKEEAAPRPAVDAAPVVVIVDAAAANIPTTPGALAKLSDARLTAVVALGEKRVIVAQTSAEVSERHKDGTVDYRTEKADPVTLLAIPVVAKGEPVPIATIKHLGDYCNDARDFVWIDREGDEHVVYLVAIDGAEKPRLLTRLPSGSSVATMACNDSIAKMSIIALITDKDGSRIASIEKSSGALKTITTSGSVTSGELHPMIASDQTKVYWYDGVAGAFMQMPIDGGGGGTATKRADKPRAHATSLSHLHANARGLYWIENYSGHTRLHHLATGKKVATTLGGADIVRLRDDVYSQGNAIWRLSDDGESLEKVVSEMKVASGSGIATHGNTAVWFVPAHAAGGEGDVMQPGELHLVQRAFTPSSSDR